jgi:hypothetical protein
MHNEKLLTENIRGGLKKQNKFHHQPISALPKTIIADLNPLNRKNAP